MNVFIVRNAEVYSNANMIRIIDALDGKFNLSIISRVREGKPNCIKSLYNKSLFEIKGNKFVNYEIELKSKMGRGLNNLMQLLIYQLVLFVLLIKNRKNIDIIHSFDLDCGLVSIIFSKIFKKKVVYHIADFYVDSRPGIPNALQTLIRSLEFYVIREAESVIICTEKRINQIKGSKPKKLRVVHNVPIANPELNKVKIDVPLEIMKTKRISFGYVGGLSKIHFTREIMSILSNDSDIFLNIAGYGDLDVYTGEIASKCQNINYYGRIDYNSAIYLYNNSDIILMIYDPSVPNHKFSAPNKLYEAMMLGKAIIVVKDTGIDDIVEKEKMGIVIEYTEKALLEAIQFLKSNPKQLEIMKKNAKIAYRNFTWDEMKSRIQSIYQEL